MSPTVEELKRLLEQWTDRFDGGDIHSIRRQINELVWWSAFYRGINASRQLLCDGPDGEKLANSSLHGLINEGYFSMQAAGVRRLVDENRNNKRPERSVNSLYRLIADIQGHAALLSRENVLAARGLIYDYEPLHDEALRRAREKAEREGKRAYMVSGEGWMLSELWHDTWDELCQIGDNARTPGDSPPDAVFEQWLSLLAQETKDVVAYVDKHLAHAATKVSRATLMPGQEALSLDRLWTAERALVRAASFVSRCFCDGTEFGGVPVPQFDVFEHLEKPFVADGAADVMQQAWDEHTRELDRCRAWSGKVAPGSAPDSYT